MSERELPPLRVSLLGDSKGYDKVMKSAIAQAQHLNSIFNKFSLNAPLTQARQLSSALKSLGNNNLNNLVNQADRLVARYGALLSILDKIQRKTFSGKGGGSPGGMWAAAAASIGKSMADAAKASAPHLAKAIMAGMKGISHAIDRSSELAMNTLNNAARIGANLIAEAGKTLRASVLAVSNVMRDVLRSAVPAFANALRSVSNVMVAGFKAAGQVFSASIRAAGQIVASAITGASRIAASAITQAGRIAATAINAAVRGYAVTAQLAASMFRTIGNTISSVARSAASTISAGIRASGNVVAAAIRSASQMGSAAIRTSGQILNTLLRRGRGGGGGGGAGGAGGGGGGSILGGGLTARADIYMHANALRSLLKMGEGLFGMAVKVQESAVAIGVFTKNAQQAQMVLNEVKDFAATTPFTRLGLLEATQNFMSYGASAKTTIDVMKQLGEVSAGNQERFNHLSFAMAQIISQGKLAGQELRQLTEQGFNPLQLMSEYTGKSVNDLREMMSKGLITHRHVLEVLKASTSQGGRYAGVLNKMSKEMGGLANQLKEGILNLGIDLLFMLETDIKKALTTMLGYLRMLEDYLKTDAGKEAIKRYAQIAKNVFVAAVAFHTIGMAIAMARWQMSQLFGVVNVLRGALYPLLFVLNLLQSSFNLLGLGFIGGIAQVIVGFGALGIGIAAVRDHIKGKGGLHEAIASIPKDLQNLSSYVSGFFYNMKENWSKLVLWFNENSKEILRVFYDVLNRLTGALWHNMMVVITFLGDAINIALNVLVDSMPMIAEKITKAMLSGIKAAFSSSRKNESIFAEGGLVDEALYLAGSMPGTNIPGLSDPATRKKLRERIDRANAHITDEPANFFMGEKLRTAISDLGTDLFNGFRHGFEGEGIDFGGLKMPELNLKVPEFKLPELPELAIPEAYTPDLAGLGAAGGGKAAKLLDTAIYKSSDYAKRSYEYMQNMQAIQSGLRGDVTKDDIPKQQLNALKGIEKNTRPGSPAPTANLSGTGGGSF